MKAAQQIAQQHTDMTAAAKAAADRAIAQDNIWGGEGYTIYVFDDNSLLAQSGAEQIAVDADDRESVMAYMSWLGIDAPLDKQRLDDMLDALAE